MASIKGRIESLGRDSLEGSGSSLAFLDITLSFVEGVAVMGS
jgi:hypothetical protein